MEFGAGWTMIAQWMAGQTEIAPGGHTLEWPFNARYVLLSKRLTSRQALTVRYDRFQVESRNAEEIGEQSGHAWTVAYLFDAGRDWRLTLEWLRVRSSSYSWSEDESLPGPVTDNQVQLSIRYALGSTPY
jgi:hypothetical protein